MSENIDEANDEWITMPTGWGELEVSRFRRPRDHMALRLLGTDLEWGQLHLPVPMDEEEADEQMPGAPSEMKQRGFHVHEISLVMDPTRGILAVGSVGGEARDDETIRERVLEEYARVSEDEHLIRERLDSELSGETEDSLWPDHEVPMGTAVILRGPAAGWEPDGTGLDPAILVDEADWPTLPDRLADALDFYTPETRPVDADDASRIRDFPRYLISAVKAMGHPMGGFIDHISCVSMMGEVKAQL